MGTFQGYFCIKYFYLLTVVFYMWCHAQKRRFPQKLLILGVLTLNFILSVILLPLLLLEFMKITTAATLLTFHMIIPTFVCPH